MDFNCDLNFAQDHRDKNSSTYRGAHHGEEVLAVERQRLHVRVHRVDAFPDDGGALQQRLLHTKMEDHFNRGCLSQGIPCLFTALVNNQLIINSLANYF